MYILLYSDKQRSRFVLDAFQLKNAGPGATLHASFWDPSRKRSSNVNRVLPCDSGCFRHTSFWNVALLLWFSHYASKRLNIFESPISLCQCLLSPLFLQMILAPSRPPNSPPVVEPEGWCLQGASSPISKPSGVVSHWDPGQENQPRWIWKDLLCKRVANELRVSICQHD